MRAKGQIIHLQNLTSLTAITFFSNPCEEKNNYLLFLYAVNPNIENIDGKKVTSGDRDSDFLKSTDGRIMINRIRLLTSATFQPNIPFNDDNSNNFDQKNSDTMSTQSDGYRRTTSKKANENNNNATRSTPIPVFRANRIDLVKTKKLTNKNTTKVRIHCF